MDNRTWKDILSISRLSPSPHNRQPWKLQIIDDRRARLYLDHGRTLRNEDVTAWRAPTPPWSYRLSVEELSRA